MRARILGDRQVARQSQRKVTMLDIDSSDEELRQILLSSPVIAIVGESNDHYYTSYQVAHYLKEKGYKVYPVNPHIEEVDGDRSYASLQDIPEPIDIVDVFRKPEALAGIVDDAIAAGAKTLWTQLDVVSLDDKPEQKAVECGLKLVSNRCIRTEHERLFP
jgi:predicted CoA-binding protein